jgi:hypothetical protein
MSIFKHVKSGKRFLFIHIPRTSGRFIEQNLEAQGWKWEPIDKNIKLTRRENLDGPNGMYDSVEGTEIAHFHKKLYEKYLDGENIPHISIIRNPIDRFISASIFLTRYYHNLYDKSYEEIQEEAENFFSSSLSFQQIDPRFPESVSWYRPQIDFISDKTHIWKFENGMGNKFSKWISDIVGVDIKMDPNLKSWADFPSKQLKKTNALIANLKIFYKKDFSKFYQNLDE